MSKRHKRRNNNKREKVLRYKDGMPLHVVEHDSVADWWNKFVFDSKYIKDMELRTYG